MPIAEAVRLCPEAVFFQGSFAHYRDASHAVADVLTSFSPTVVLASLDGAYLDLGGTARLYPVTLVPLAVSVPGAVRAYAGLACRRGTWPTRRTDSIAVGYAVARSMA